MEISRFWQSTTPGDAGPYSSDQFNAAFKKLLHGFSTSVGPMLDAVAGTMVSLRVQQTTIASANVEVVNGSALVDGTYYENTATVTIAVAANASGNPRIDTIVLRKDWTAQTIRLAIKTGTPAVTPSPPSLTQTSGVMWEAPLADIDVASGFATISDTNIRSRAIFANISPQVVLPNIVNNSGQTLRDGDVVAWDNSLARSVKLTTQGGDPNVAGVWQGLTSNGGSGRLVVGGYHWVNMIGVGGLNVGDRIEASGTAGVARVATRNGNLGRLILLTGGGKPLAYIDVNHRTEDYVLIRDEKATGTNGGTFTSGAWRTRDLNTEVSDTGNIASLSSNQITLLAGIYRVRWWTMGRQCDNHKSRLQDVTGGAPGTTLVVGSPEIAGGAVDTQTKSVGEGRITLTATSILELQHECLTTKAGTGFGLAAGFSLIEVYSVIEFWKEG